MMLRARFCLAALVAVAGLAVLVSHLFPEPPGPASTPDAARMCVEREAAPPGDVAHLGSLNGSLWPVGKTLRVKFLEGGPRARNLALNAMRKWEKVCNVRFVESRAADAEIRVRFQPGQGSWSYIGTGNLQVPLSRHTMNLGWLNETTAESEFYVATHESGHALGFVHGQNLPNAAIPWDEAKVYRYFGGPPNYWDRATIFDNVLAKYSARDVSTGEFDPKSIMQYPVDAKLTKNGFSIGWNKSISAGDAAFARRAYPFAGDGSGGAIKCPDPASFLVQP